jgi:hypothetical protein
LKKDANEREADREMIRKKEEGGANTGEFESRGS